VAALWPIPLTYSSGDKVLWIEPNFSIVYSGIGAEVNCTYDSASTSATSTIVQTAISETYATLFTKTFWPWMFNPRNTDFDPNHTKGTYITRINLVQNGTDPESIYKPEDGVVDESYTLSVTEAGRVTITAPSSIGLAYGLTTFTQLFYKTAEGKVYTKLAPVEISDAPKFQHRGLNMDVSRSYYAPSDIERMIDALAYSKMNRLHVHITDGQSWPLQVPSLPELAAAGAYSPGLSYSPAVLKSIQEYGAVRGVEVFLEIDMPGHTSAIAFSHPDLIAAFNVQPDWSTVANEPPSGSLKLNSSAVYSFLETLWDDLLPRVSPYSSYFHTGGDEVNANAYLLDDTVQSNDTSVLQPLIQKLVNFNHAKVRAAGLTPIVWEEMLLVWNLTLGSDVVVQTWLSDESVAETVALGHKALAGNYNFWYLDCGEGQWVDFYPGKDSAAAWPYADYCSPRHNWRLMYSYDPLSGVPDNATHLVLGGETHMWSEQTDPINVDRQVWPRACAAGEVLWSGAKDETGQNRSQITASPRLADMRERLVARGVMAEPVYMPFCSQNGTQCVS